MKLANINPKEVVFSLDIGTRTIIGTVGVVREKKFHVIEEYYIEHEERAMIDGQIHDINLVANGVNIVKRQLEANLNFKLTNVSIAAAGRFLRTTTVKAEIDTDSEKEFDREIIRSLELTAVKKAEDEVGRSTEGRLYCVGYSVKSYFLNGYIISNLLSHKGEKAAVEVIATFLPRSVVDSLYAVMNKVGLNVVNLTLEPIAAMEAAIPQNLRLLNLALVDIGAGTSDIAISSKDSISAYGMVPQAGDEVTEAIAQNYLVDFNTAERIKRECSLKETITYIDVLGIENNIDAVEILHLIVPVVEKISNEISSKIIELNGGKSPNAIFLVGGGAHTPGLKEALAEYLNLQPQRIAIKGREAVVDCVCPDNNLGSTGVTVLGIALNSIKKLGNDFIDVTLNGGVVSLFNSHRHTVVDVIMQAGINPKVLIGKNGKNIRFTLNDIKRVAFGTMAENAKIYINGKLSSLEDIIKEGDNIDITFAKDGRDASPKVLDFVKSINSVGFYINDELYNMEPTAYINEVIVTLNDCIHEGDIVQIIYPVTLGDLRKILSEQKKSLTYLKDDIELKDDYVIGEGDRLTTKIVVSRDAEAAVSLGETKADNKTIIEVIVNEKKVIMDKKQRYVFIDVFDFIDFDLSTPKGNLVLTLNGNKAGYYDNLSNGDNILIKWE